MRRWHEEERIAESKLKRFLSGRNRDMAQYPGEPLYWYIRRVWRWSNLGYWRKAKAYIYHHGPCKMCRFEKDYVKPRQVERADMAFADPDLRDWLRVVRKSRAKWMRENPY